MKTFDRQWTPMQGSMHLIPLHLYCSCVSMACCWCFSPHWPGPPCTARPGSRERRRNTGDRMASCSWGGEHRGCMAKTVRGELGEEEEEEKEGGQLSHRLEVCSDSQSTCVRNWLRHEGTQRDIMTKRRFTGNPLLSSHVIPSNDPS